MKLHYVILILVGIISSPVGATNISQDEEKIKSTVHSFATMADQNAFEYLGRLLTNELTLDYTSLFGGQAQRTSNIALMQQWAGFLPGFDTIFHELKDMRVAIKGKQAQVNVSFTASHWVNEDFWQVSGRYVFTLEKQNEHWLINSVTAIKEDESGSRDVLSKVGQLAEQKLLERSRLRVAYH